DPDAMLRFAETIFGEPFGWGTVITEARLTLDEWSDGAIDRVRALGLAPIDGTALDPVAIVDALEDLGDDPHGRAVADTLLAGLYSGPSDAARRADNALLLDLLRAHPFIRRAIGSAADA